MIERDLVPLVAATSGSMGLLGGALIAGIVSLRRLNWDQTTWIAAQERAERDSWREHKRSAYISFLRAHGQYWDLRSEYSFNEGVLEMYRGKSVDSEEVMRHRGIVKDRNQRLVTILEDEYRHARRLADEVSLYDSLIGDMCRRSIPGFPASHSWPTRKDEDDRGNISRIHRAMQKSLGLDALTVRLET